VNTPARRLWELLELEREAARRADVEALVTLQEQKRELMQALGEQGVEETERDALAQTSAENIELIRHLVAMLGVLAGVSTSTYGRRGMTREDAAPGAMRRRG